MYNEDVGSNKMSLVVKIVGMGLIAILVAWGVLSIGKVSTRTTETAPAKTTSVTK